MENFYGGPKGQDFSIAQIFTSKVQLDSDLTRGWTSPISVGEFVMISYGMPNDPNYNTYKKEDLDAQKNIPEGERKTYNSTLWQKIYADDGSGSASGLSYKLISSMTGNTPNIEFAKEAIDADQLPDIVVNPNDLDYHKVTFKLPQSQTILMNEPINKVDVDQDPNVIFDKGDKEKGGTINTPTLTFYIPKSQNISMTVGDPLSAGEAPMVTFDKGSRDEEGNIVEGPQGGTVNEPVLHFQLPMSQNIQEATIEEVLNVGISPSVRIDKGEAEGDTGTVNNPILKFKLPRSQDIKEAVMEQQLDSSEEPSVRLDKGAAPGDTGTANEPILKLSLPRAAKFYYGELLGEDRDYIDVTDPSFASYGKGDYYINAPTGFIYLITAKEGTTCSFTYMACLQSPLPEVAPQTISPYADAGDGTFVPANPTVTKELVDDVDVQWKLNFGLPKAPLYDSDVSFVGVDEQGDVTSLPQDSNTIKLNFKIPRGSKLFAGNVVSDTTLTSTIDGSKPGDFYINSSSGLLYKLNLSNTWEEQPGSLKGPVGDALHIVVSYTIQETATLKDSLNAGVQYIEDNYVGSITSDDLFSITWIDFDTSEKVSYWYFKTDKGIWDRVQITGGVADVIESSYNPENEGNVTNKTYSINYINKLINEDVIGKDKTKVTYSANKIDELLLNANIQWGSFTDLISPTTE